MPFFTSGFRLLMVIVTAIVAMAMAAYFPIFGNDFLRYDDATYVVDNPHIRVTGAGDLIDLLTLFYASNWHPLTWMSHALDFHLFGLNPAAHHGMNLFLHILNSLLVMAVLTRLLELVGHPRPIVVAGIAAIFFAGHPQHVESVAWLAERKDLLFTLFYLISVLAYFEYARQEKVKYLYYAGIGFLFSAMSKPMAISLPLVLMILDYYPLNRLNSLRDLLISVREKIIFIMMSAGLAILTMQAQQSAIEFVAHIDFASRLINAAYSMLAYIGLWFWPVGLSPYYPFPGWILQSGVEAIWPLLIVLSIAVVVTWLAFARGQRVWLALFLFYLITLLPVLGLVKVGGLGMADRYTYLPLIIVYLLPGIAFFHAWRAVTDKWVPLAGLVMLCLMLAYLTQQQTQVWRNDKSLWFTVAYLHPGEVDVAYMHLGDLLMDEGKNKEAISYYGKLSLHPKSPFRRDKFINMGVAYKRVGDFEAAMQSFHRALEIAPEDPPALFNLGRVLQLQGQLGEAEQLYLRALKGDADNIKVLYGLATLYTQTNKVDQAISLWTKAHALSPDSISINLNLAQFYLGLGDKEKARQHLEHILSLKPKHEQAAKLLGALGE